MTGVTCRPRGGRLRARIPSASRGRPRWEREKYGRGGRLRDLMTGGEGDRVDSEVSACRSKLEKARVGQGWAVCFAAEQLCL